MLKLTRKVKRKDKPAESKVNIYHGDKLIGVVDVTRASLGYASLGFDFLPDYRIVREEAECKESKQC